MAALSAVLLVAVTALAGFAAPPPGKGHGNGNGKGKGHGKSAQPTAAAGQYQYGPGGKQYGKRKVTICHRGKTIRIAAPAVKAHLRHGDHLGPC